MPARSWPRPCSAARWLTGTHFTKAGTRALINSSPEPFSNWGASVGEDVGWLGALYLMWRHPLVLLILLGLFVLLACWLLPRIVRGLRVLRQRLQRLGTALSGGT